MSMQTIFSREVLFSLQIRRKYTLGILSLLAAFLTLCAVYQKNVQKGNYRGNDIFYIWSDGHSIAHGVNPYSKIHGSDMLKNEKYTTYLPGFFLLVSAYVALGNDTFVDWMSFWKPMGFLIHFTIGVILFFALLPRGGLWLALLGSQFWFISRWTIGVMNSGQIDGLAILILLISLFALPKYRKLALILFGASLSIKQIGIFMLPVYLLQNIDVSRHFTVHIKKILIDLLYVALVPLLLCLPFLFWDAKGLLMSLIFSATRSPGGHIKVPSIDELLGYMGIIAKFPMLLMMAFVYFLVLERKIGIHSAALVIFLCFVSFNSVLFKQYMPWFCAFLGLALAELQTLRIKISEEQSPQGQINAIKPN